jgi:RHS repeat-associated protein
VTALDVRAPGALGTGDVSATGDTAVEALARIEDWVRAQAGRRELDVRDGRVHGVRELGAAGCAYAYDARGDLTAIDEPGVGTTRFRYDTERRLTEVIEPDGRATAFAYGEHGSLRARGELRFEHDDAGRVVRRHAGDAGCAVYRYDEQGRLASARTATIETEYGYDPQGRIARVAQTRDGACIEARFAYDAAGRPRSLAVPGGGTLEYAWDEHGRPAEVRIGARGWVRFAADAEARTGRMTFSNGVEATTVHDPVDGRTLRSELSRSGDTLLAERFAYTPSGALAADGETAYAYDALGRVVRAGDETFAYDARDNVVRAAGRTFAYDARDRVLHASAADGMRTAYEHDARGRLTRRIGPDGERVHRYDDAGRLVEVLHDAVRVAAFEYDHEDRLARATSADGAERYLYGPAGELLAVTRDDGTPLRLLVRTPLGVVAEVHGDLDTGELAFRHDDRRGSCRVVTDVRGGVVATHRYGAFGMPCSIVAGQDVPAHATAGGLHHASYTGQLWYPALGLYWFGTRWYDPALQRFLTPDAYTARPDDARLVSPALDAQAQAACRTLLLDDWLRRPRLRNRYAFCGNDPVGATDPDGHWSFGGFVLSLLGAIWTLPNTIFGLLIEITCLVGEVLRWIVWLFTLGHVSWSTPGFDAASSSRLNAFALVFSGGWLGSFPSLLGITFGNVFFVYKEWETNPVIAAGGTVSPTAYGGAETIPVHDALYEHELRHTNQYGWFGPFFHLGMPLWGFYVWDVIFNGYRNSWCETDARAHGGL